MELFLVDYTAIYLLGNVTQSNASMLESRREVFFRLRVTTIYQEIDPKKNLIVSEETSFSRTVVGSGLVRAELHDPVGFPGFPNPGWIAHPPTTLRSHVSHLKSPQSPGVLVLECNLHEKFHQSSISPPAGSFLQMSCNGMQDALESDQNGSPMRTWRKSSSAALTVLTGRRSSHLRRSRPGDVADT